VANEVKTKLTAEDDELRKSLKEMKKEIEDFHNEAKEVGKTVKEWVGAAIGAATIAEFMKKAVEAAREWNKVQHEYEEALLKTGTAAATTKESLLEMADAIQRVTNFSNEQVVQAGTLLSAYTKLNSEGFERALKLSADLAGYFGGSMASAAKVLGTALNDPKTALETLHAVGIAFDEDTQRTAASLSYLGKEAELEALLLSKLEERFGSLAEEAKNAEDPLAGAKNALNDIYVQIGEGLDSAFKQMLEWISDFAKAIGIFDEASDKMTWFEKSVLAVSVALKQLKDIYTTFSSMASSTAMMPMISIAEKDLADIEKALEKAQKEKRQAPTPDGIERDPEVRRLQAARDAQKQYLQSLKESDKNIVQEGGDAMARNRDATEKAIEEKEAQKRKRREAAELEAYERERQKNMTEEERQAERDKKAAERNAARGANKSGLDAYNEEKNRLKQEDDEIERLSKDDPTGRNAKAFYGQPPKEKFQSSIEDITSTFMRIQSAAAGHENKPEEIIKNAVETVGQAQAQKLDEINANLEIQIQNEEAKKLDPGLQPVQIGIA
jgi:hypothetical protein